MWLPKEKNAMRARKKTKKMWKGKCEAIYDAAGFNLFHYSDTYK